VLICHQHDRLDSIGLASWLASSMRLAGVIEIRGDRSRLWRAVRREWKRSGVLGLADVIAFRMFARLRHRRSDTRWLAQEVVRLQRRYPARIDGVPRIVVDNPNNERARAFIAGLAPDLLIARCKFILSPGIFTLARHGSFALHPGICPEYRNAHGCFWALANRDLGRVGMTLLKIDAGVDTGPVLLQARYAFDEVRESHTRIQHRVVTENLDRIADTLIRVVDGYATPADTSARSSAAWGQPRLTAYVRWKRAARRDQHPVDGLPAVP
jgi:folate-dependent phosphoribosylglycinamide formyltransferase PurN